MDAKICLARAAVGLSKALPHLAHAEAYLFIPGDPRHTELREMIGKLSELVVSLEMEAGTDPECTPQLTEGRGGDAIANPGRVARSVW